MYNPYKMIKFASIMYYILREKKQSFFEFVFNIELQYLKIENSNLLLIARFRSSSAVHNIKIVNVNIVKKNFMNY